jgi:plastocyanin
MRRSALTSIALLVLALLSAIPARAEASATGAFLSLWQRTDLPVATGAVQRSWLWGNQLSVNPTIESYADSPGGVRAVQYYDKGRMEITDPQSNPADPWYVTSGLLTRELISGRLQLGDNTFDVTGQPARVAVAGDASNTFPTYANLQSWIDHPASDSTGQPVTTALTPAGQSSYSGDVSDGETVISHYVTYAGPGGQPIGYNIPRGFWDFMHQSGPIYVNGSLTQASPFYQWEFVLGYPIGEPFWAQVTLAGQPTWVMIQPFERRVLTYTPSNPANWRVEMGNIGQHYYTWRYQQLSTPVAATTVELGDFYYLPATLSVPAGTEVVWSVVGQRTNSVTADDGSWDSGDLNHGDFFTHEFDTPGTYPYHSRYYAWMKGTIVVTAGAP